jgi:hypothetical protein
MARSRLATRLKNKIGRGTQVPLLSLKQWMNEMFTIWIVYYGQKLSMEVQGHDEARHVWDVLQRGGFEMICVRP